MVDNKRTAYYEELLANYVSKKRHAHSCNVAETAYLLAKHFAPAHAHRAELAGLLHDNAKSLSDTELITEAGRFDIEVSPGEQLHPHLLHGKVGAALLKERFGVRDMRVVQAVADHVTGRVGMGLLSMILFVADQIASDRDFDGVDGIRDVAKVDLDKAALMVAMYKLRYIVSKLRPIEAITVDVYNELLMRVSAGE